MKFYNKQHSCCNCNNHIDLKVFDYSSAYFGVALCISCQKWFKDKVDASTPETIQLYFSLKQRGVPAQLEKNDGFKTIDIAVVDAKVNIEVDGAHHNFSSKQALSDLKRTYHAFRRGYLTLRIPNSLVRDNLEITADYITDFLNISKRDLI
jgi:hypothetical protein